MFTFKHYLLGVLFVLMLVGCGGGETAAPASTVAPAEELPLVNEALSQVTKVGSVTGGMTVDATPNADGTMVYFTVTGGETSGVYKVAASGGEITAVSIGAPFVSPLGLAISSDSQTLYVAETSQENNGVYVIPVAGGTPTLLAGTQGTLPRVPEIIHQNGQDQLYFSGTAENQPAVFQMPTDGSAAPTVVFKGSPLVDPSGVAITQAGVVYVVDKAASGNGMGTVFRIQGETAESIATNVHTDDLLAGATLTLDESALLVSHLHPQENTAQVLVINLSTLEKAIFNKVIGSNQSAGGVHRAHNTGQLAWADYRGGGVYFLEP